MAVSNEEFRRALGHFASSVTVVTTKCAGGELAGITVTAFSSLSLDPPLVLVCIDKRASLHDRLAMGRAFAVNMLADDQEVVSRRFAASGPEQFDGIGFSEGETGSPLLDGVIAAIECRIVERFASGDHTIIVGQVEATTIAEGKPLLYFRGRYNRLA
jgi:flavin reductase (DIM6/NTAB) family NADH-FMN oxidoreductase RutF